MVHTQQQINTYYEKAKNGTPKDCSIATPEEHKNVEILTFAENDQIYIYRRENKSLWEEVPHVGSD